MANRTKTDLLKENEDLRAQVALLRGVVERLLVGPPTPMGIPFPMPSIQPPAQPVAPGIPWPTTIPLTPTPWGPVPFDPLPRIICGGGNMEYAPGLPPNTAYLVQ